MALSERDEMFERVAAAKTLINARSDRSERAGMELAAFMDIFHPGDPRTDELVRDARNRRQS